jgi:hypothetical protein
VIDFDFDFDFTVTSSKTSELCDVRTESERGAYDRKSGNGSLHVREQHGGPAIFCISESGGILVNGKMKVVNPG